MTDPYQVLGVDYSANEKQIKLAYKELVKQYHPDRFQEEEEVKLATQKMSDINSAYDQIMDDRRRGVSPQSYAKRAANTQRTQQRGTAQEQRTSGARFRRYSEADYNTYSSYGVGMGMGMGMGVNPTGYGGIEYVRVRSIIESGDLGTADGMLDKIPPIGRSAEWHYLKGMIYSRRGWLNEAYHSVRTATQMDPANAEYENTFREMNRTRSGYMSGGKRGGDKAASFCASFCDPDVCICCCEMFGNGI